MSGDGAFVHWFNQFHFSSVWDSQADVSGEQAQSQEMFGIVLICVHAAMVVSIMFQAFISMQVRCACVSVLSHTRCFFVEVVNFCRY